MSSIWGGYVDLRGARAENVAAQHESAAIEMRLQQQRALAQRTDAAQALLDLQDRTRLATLAADVIAGLRRRRSSAR